MNPIIIVGASRSGTSLTAGIFAHHGVWVGNQQPSSKINPKGFYENVDFKDYLKAEYLPIKDLQFPEPKPDFDERVQQILRKGGYKGGPWLIKHGGIHWKLWTHWEAHYVCVRRPYETSNKSRRKAGIPEMTRDMWDRIQEGLDICVSDYGGVNVYPDDMKSGDFSSIIIALERCGIEPNMKTVQSFYDPKLWHHT